MRMCMYMCVGVCVYVCVSAELVVHKGSEEGVDAGRMRRRGRGDVWKMMKENEK